MTEKKVSVDGYTRVKKKGKSVPVTAVKPYTRSKPSKSK